MPAEGRAGAPPDWPIPGKPTAREREAWAELWATPQAVAWERLGWTRTVARYCRLMVKAERPSAPTYLSGEVRQMEDRLGLTPMSMLRLRWEVVADELAEARADHADDDGGARARLRVVDPDLAQE